MLICFRTLNMERLELNNPLIKEYLWIKNAPVLCASLSQFQWPTRQLYLQTHTNACTSRGKTVPQPSPGNTFLFAHSDQNILKANVAVEWPAVLVHSRKVLGLVTTRRWNVLTVSVRAFPQSLKTNADTAH